MIVVTIEEIGEGREARMRATTHGTPSLLDTVNQTVQQRRLRYLMLGNALTKLANDAIRMAGELK